MGQAKGDIHNDMTKRNTNNDDKYNYQSLKNFVLHFLEWYYPKNLPPPSESPSDFFERIEKISLPKAKRGLQMAINDIVEIISCEWDPLQISEADKRFAAAGLSTLSEMRLRYSKKYSKIFKSGVINNEIEYYIIKGVIDGGFVELGTPDAIRLQAMLNAYEDLSRSR